MKEQRETDVHDALSYDISYTCIFHNMAKIKNKAIPQANKNNKTKPENLMKKEYLESYDELKKDIQKSQQAWGKKILSTIKTHFGVMVKWHL